MNRSSFQGSDNAKTIADTEKALGVSFVSKELFPGKKDGHQYGPGQKLKLVGLEDYPEFNGELVTITSIRENGTFGNAYYFSTNNSKLASQLNWVYEYRLEAIE